MKTVQRDIQLRLHRQDCSYPIRIHATILSQLPALILKRWKGASVFILTDENVKALYGRNLLRHCGDAGLNASLFFISAGERSKNFKVVHALQTALLENQIRRDSLIIALGGGVVGDVAGFVAATVLRGVKYVHVPTTLVAQVDSSVGGKVGIDHPLGKNLIGAFHQPAAVFIDPDILRTLSSQEFRNGLAEVVKIAVALDGKFFSYLEQNAEKISKENTLLLSEIVRWAVGLKAAVVEQDELESNLRKALNVGHTIGHALEVVSNYELKHGEAVSIGIAAESEIAVRLGLLSEKDSVKILDLLRMLKLPTRVPTLRNKSKFFSALSADKKFEGNATRFALPAGIGRTAIGVEVPNALIEQLISNNISHRRKE